MELFLYDVREYCLTMRKRIQLNEIHPPAEGELGGSDLNGVDGIEVGSSRGWGNP